ncbi:MAG: alpha-amylase [Mediterranea sp.]|jgi:glycosidase|nr:alpha-amylase [Mediterranea sp.]
MKKLLNISLMLMLLLWSCGSGNGGDEPQPGPTPPDGTEEATDGYVIYEANPGLFGTSQALNALRGQLDRIGRLGVNVLWLMPIYEQGEVKAVGSPYCVRDYRALKPSYGTMADLKALVGAAHAKGMMVILDWVGNHTSWDNAWITEHPDWYSKDANGDIISPPGTNWGDVADLNYDSREMRAAMLDAMTYWVTEADIDGFRCDYAEGVPADFWKSALTALRAAKGSDPLLMLAESGNASLYDAGFDMIYAWNFAYRLQSVYGGSTSVSDLYSTSSAELATATNGKTLMRHITNHDMANEASPLATYRSAEGAFSAFVANVSMGGCPMIYSSQEVAYPSPLSFFVDRTMDFTANPGYQADYEKLMGLYRGSPALQHGTVKLYSTGRAVCAYRVSATEKILVLVNTAGSAEVVNLPMERVGDKAVDMWTGASTTLLRTMELAPYEYHIWKIE